MRLGAAALSFLLFAVTSGAMAPTIARADGSGEPSDTPKSPNQIKAEAHYKRARELYQLGRYREAIAQLEAALKLNPQGAELLYNLGLVHEKLGDADEAIEAYRHYLKVLGSHADPEEKKKIQGIIRRLEGAKTELKAKEAKSMEHRFTPLSAGLLVGSGIALIGTVVFGVAALKNDRAARDYQVTGIDHKLSGRDDLISTSKTYALLTDIFAGVTVLAGTGAIALYFTSEFQKQDNPNETPIPRANLRVLPMVGGGAVRFEVAF